MEKVRCLPDGCVCLHQQEFGFQFMDITHQTSRPFQKRKSRIVNALACTDATLQWDMMYPFLLHKCVLKRTRFSKLTTSSYICLKSAIHLQMWDTVIMDNFDVQVRLQSRDFLTHHLYDSNRWSDDAIDECRSRRTLCSPSVDLCIGYWAHDAIDKSSGCLLFNPPLSVIVLSCWASRQSASHQQAGVLFLLFKVHLWLFLSISSSGIPGPEPCRFTVQYHAQNVLIIGRERKGWKHARLGAVSSGLSLADLCLLSNCSVILSRIIGL
jgi:hypothetical protein